MEPLGKKKQLLEAFKVEEIITASQVANLLQIHLRTVYKLARRGSIPDYVIFWPYPSRYL